ncbi:hypothetical protein GCK72_008323 [Caenorhabditis remanei]|uniref:BHLH domain-containing protein n=1 Tax=Caenorhabditis remanei TaxID=31234 RepID=A0A6A5GYB1_CAERE|nr:hypothetical protein GCK72_008323 [Caenorhabditis remanei]KAF1760077.1 hypothetical protein GCK72_008323 [Caenorhabditis remanei]
MSTTPPESEIDQEVQETQTVQLEHNYHLPDVKRFKKNQRDHLRRLEISVLFDQLAELLPWGQDYRYKSIAMILAKAIEVFSGRAAEDEQEKTGEEPGAAGRQLVFRNMYTPPQEEKQG